MTATAIERPLVHPVIPGPRGHPLVGMAPALRRDLLGTLLDGFARYGDVVAYPIGPAQAPQRMRRRVVALHHPDDVRRVFTDLDLFTRDTPSYRVLRELFGGNLVTTSGATWRRQKRTLQPLFTRRTVGQYAALIEREARKAVEQPRLRADGTVDAARAMEEYALRVLGHTLFKEQDGIDDDTIAALERLVPVVGRLVRSRATQVVRLPLTLPTRSNKRFAATRDALYATVERVVARREAQERAAAAAPADDLLTRLREARDPDDGTQLSEQVVRDQTLIFLLAGHTTTSNALTTTLYLLGRHPEVQQQVAEAAAATPTTDLAAPDLVRAAVQEALRLYPPSYVLGRRVLHDAEIGGHRLPAGTLVLVSPWVTHRHPDFWEEPERFDPSRFMGEDERPPYAWFPFGGGARSCIGRHFALLEATILVRALLSRHRLEALDANVPLDQLISMRPAGPVRVRWHPR